MARLRVSETTRANSTARSNTSSSLYRDPSVASPALRSSPSSDKENESTRATSKASGMAPLQASKRRRLGDRDGSTHSESSAHEDEESDDVEAVRVRRAPVPATRDAGNSTQYDPYQDMSERRQLRKDFRNLDKAMQDQRLEWMKPDSRELERAIKRQDNVYRDVKQTSEATLDSRMLVNAGELTYKRTKNMTVGDNASGIDVEEFIGKCITFMQAGADRSASATQRRHRAAADEDDEADLRQGDALDWAFLGLQACMPFNKRPATTSFLLGPLSVQKAPRAPRQRRERLQRSGPVEAVQAKELRAEEMGRAENSSVTAACRQILDQFRKALEKGLEDVASFWEDRDEDADIDPAEEAEFNRRNVVMEDGGLSLFKFVIHPTDFGQTVENMFYLSFLIKDDFIQLKYDEDGLPSLHAVDDEIRQDQTRTKGERFQQIFELDWQTWRGLIEMNDIEKPMIKDRSQDQSATQVNANGWYG